MRLATFNLESLDGESDAETALLDRLAVLRPQLLRLDADVLCLQEVNGQRVKGATHRTLAALDVLLQDTPYLVYARAATSGPGGEGVADVHNLVTLSRFEIVEHRELRHALVPAIKHGYINACPPLPGLADIVFDRPLLETKLRLGSGQLLTVLNVHLRAPLASPIPGQKEAPFLWKTVSGWAEGFYLSNLKRAGQALEARLRIDQLLDAGPGALLVVAGDFNAEDHETPLKILTGAEEDTGNGRLTARSMAIIDRSIPLDRRFTILHHGRPEMVDHILVSRMLLAHVRGVEVHNETLSDETIGYGRMRHPTASYHAPVVAEISLD
jgi:endonuclease/exonuclease/phosphatase family metal-dependent hydrolase